MPARRAGTYASSIFETYKWGYGQSKFTYKVVVPNDFMEFRCIFY